MPSPIVEVCRRLDLDAENLGPGVIRDPLSTLFLLSFSVPICVAWASRLILFPLPALFSSGLTAVAVSGGLGGAAPRAGDRALSTRSGFLVGSSWLRSVGSGVRRDFF